MSLDLHLLTNLVTLNCASAGISGTLDLHGITTLTTLTCSTNSITNLIITGCSGLTDVQCHDNPLTVSTTLDLSAANGLQNLYAYNCSGLVVINMTGITTMTGFIQVNDCSALTTLTTPNVVSVDQDIKTFNCPNLGALSFPALTGIGGELDFYNSGVSGVSIPNLSLIGTVSSGQLNGYNCTSLLSFSAPSLQQVISGQIDFHGCTTMTTMALDALLNCEGITVLGCTSLTSLSLASPGGLSIGGSLIATGCTSLSSVDVSAIGVSTSAPNPTNDFTGCAISPSANINSILANYVLCTTGGPAFSLDLSGVGNAAPSGQGVLDKATINGTPGCSCVTN